MKSNKKRCIKLLITKQTSFIKKEGIRGKFTKEIHCFVHHLQLARVNWKRFLHFFKAPDGHVNTTGVYSRYRNRNNVRITSPTGRSSEISIPPVCGEGLSKGVDYFIVGGVGIDRWSLQLKKRKFILFLCLNCNIKESNANNPKNWIVPQSQGK